MTLALLPQTWPFIGPTRLEQTFHWLISVSRDFRSPNGRSQYICFYQYLFIHPNKGSLFPPCATLAGPRSPQIITLFTQSHRVFRPSLRIPVPCSGSLFLVPDTRSSFRILNPRSGHNPRFITHTSFESVRGDVKIHWQSLQTFAKVCWQLSIT